jgi:multidrug resistance efflux pump
MKLPRTLWAIPAIVAIVAVVAVASTAAPWASRREELPTARVLRGALALDVHANGELRAGRMLTMAAPPAGAMLRLVTLAETGTSVRAGDVVMEFDPAEQQYQLEQGESELAEAEQEIVKMRADADVQAAQDQLDLLIARFDVRRAELDTAAGEELVGANEAKKRQLTLEESRRRLEQAEDNVRQRAATSRAALTVVEEKRNKARLAAERARQIIESLVVRSPIDGLVVVRENRDASGGFFFSGMTLPEYRAGDAVSVGRPVVDVFSAGEMEIRAKVNEQDRANLGPGHAAAVVADALPGQRITAKVAALGELVSRGTFFDATGPARQFDVVMRLERPEPRLRPGTTVRVVVSGAEVRDALYVPRQALFERNGKPVVFVRAGSGFEPRQVKVTHRSETRVAIEGIPEGTPVALVDPDASREAPGQSPAAAPAATRS